MKKFHTSDNLFSLPCRKYFIYEWYFNCSSRYVQLKNRVLFRHLICGERNASPNGLQRLMHNGWTISVATISLLTNHNDQTLDTKMLKNGSCFNFIVFSFTFKNEISNTNPFNSKVNVVKNEYWASIYTFVVDMLEILYSANELTW